MYEKVLIIFDLANNHMGDVEYGKRIIREFAKVVKPFRKYFDFAIKMQYRHLDTFIHPDFKDRMDIKFVKRFSETRLNPNELKAIKDTIVEEGFIPICTPFDEPSVDLVLEHGFEIVKVASCSFTDWPLLEHIVKVSNKPMILSTAGEPLTNIDRVVSFLMHRNRKFALMHCIAEYPTEESHLYLNQIDLLKNRYPGIPIGFSTHEDPKNITAIVIALSKGARLLERHIGLRDKYPLNAYSSTPEDIVPWLEAGVKALEMMGEERLKETRYEPSEKELKTLFALKRGAFAKRNIKTGEEISISDVFFAIPTCEGQWVANDFSKYAKITALKDIKEKEALTAENTSLINTQEKVYEIVLKVRDFIKKAGIIVPPGAELEISHHYGIDKFYEYGLVMITVVNREYCKKLLILLPGQTHPEQYHLKKEETFFVVYGELELYLDGKKKICKPGEVVTIERGVKHMMTTKTGCIIEEISTTHYKEDSFYTDETIMQNKKRKTVVSYWQE